MFLFSRIFGRTVVIPKHSTVPWPRLPWQGPAYWRTGGSCKQHFAAEQGEFEIICCKLRANLITAQGAVIRKFQDPGSKPQGILNHQKGEKRHSLMGVWDLNLVWRLGFGPFRRSRLAAGYGGGFPKCAANDSYPSASSIMESIAAASGATRANPEKRARSPISVSTTNVGR